MALDFFVQKDIVNTVMRCRPVSSRLITILLRATLFNIRVAQAYYLTSHYDDNEMKEFYDQLQNVVDQTPKLCKGTGMQKWARMLVKTGKALVDTSAMTTQVRGDSDFWSLPPLTMSCWRTLLVITKHAEDGPGIAQTDNTTTRLTRF